MNNYIEKVIGNGETVSYRAQMSLWNFTGSFIVLSLSLLFALVFAADSDDASSPLVPLLIALFSAARIYLIYSSTELAITNRRVIAKYGFIKRETVEINLDKIESLKVSQNILGRICNFGTILVVGSGGSPAVIYGIADPLVFRRRYDEVVHPAGNAHTHSVRIEPSL